MCGIAGLFGFGERVADPRERHALVRRMADSMVHRGPDASGSWGDPEGRCELAHRRLSIIDTSDAGRQPMESGDGRWVITFNGEIYNYRDVRTALESEGIGFRGRTDTEVLLAALQLWGLDALSRLDGMFAFAAFNRDRGELLLGRDPFGEKPLYYFELPGGALAFASELQALNGVPGFDCTVSVDAMAEVLMFQYIGAPRTIYQQVAKLPPGHWMVARPGEPVRIGRYFEFRPGATGSDARPIGELADELEEILVRSIRRRLIADVPLGAFLSGGVDSSTVCALVRRRLDIPLKTFSIGFEKASESEHETARLFARHLGTEHFDRVLTPDASAFLLGIGHILDEPNADSSCMPTYLLSEFAREQVTVAVSGDGGDEMFAGYGRYFQMLEGEQQHLRGSRAGWHPGQAYYSDSILVSTEPHIRELFGDVPQGLAEHLHRLREELNQETPPLFCRLRKSDVDNYMPGAVLPKVDRMSMRHSLEVRTPFLNTEVARFAERLPERVLYRSGTGKLVLREIAYRYLPRELIDAPKKGFGIPMSRWGREPLLDAAGQMLESNDSRLREFLGRENIDRFLKRQRSRSGFSTYQVWGAAMLESWLRHHPIRFPAVQAVGGRTSARVSKSPAKPPLYVYDLGRKRFLVVEEDASWLEGFSSNSTADRDASAHILGRAFDQIEGAQVAGTVPERGDGQRASAPLSIPGWGEAIGERHRSLPSALSGATLVFPSADASKALSEFELKKWRHLGIGKAVFYHPHRYDGTLFSIELRSPLGLSDLGRVARLWRNRVAAWTRIECGRLDGLATRSPALKRVPMQSGAELSQRFMLFQGIRQLPPVPVSHEDIGQLGGGRYSIWEQRCIFSALTPVHPLSRFWVVEKTKDTEALLPSIPTIIERASESTSDYIDRLARWFQSDRAPETPPDLKSGSRVVVVTHALPPGGAERQWCYLAIGLKAKGLVATVVVTDHLEGANAHYRSLLVDNGIEILDARSLDPVDVLSGLPDDPDTVKLLSPSHGPFGPKLLWLYAALKRLAPAAIFAQLDEPNLAAAVAGAIAGVPRVVMSFRNYSPQHFSYLANDWFLGAYRTVLGSSRVIATGNSHAANEDYARWIGIDHGRVAWIPNAIDANSLPAPSASKCGALRASLGIAEESPVVLGVFRLSEEKQPLTFLRVCERIRARIPKLKVLIAGIGPLARDMEALIVEARLQDTVKLLGRRDDIPELMQASSLLLLTSSHEGMPNVVMEAQAVGLPVVATRTGGTPDCVADGETGLVRDVGDEAGLADACVGLLEDPEMRSRMGEASRLLMRSHYSIAAMTERYLAVVQKSGRLRTSDFKRDFQARRDSLNEVTHARVP
jgi:asparagine synthase (glutamine-hydrolysing)